MANVFKDILEALNKPLPGTGSKDKDKAEKKQKKAHAKIKQGPEKVTSKSADAKKAARDQAKAVDVQAEMRRRDVALKRAARKAEAEKRRELLEAQRELAEMRRTYEKQLSEEAKEHASSEDFTYTVASGDTLSGIAKRFMDDASRWPEIYEANKAKIENPNLIYPGQTFVIPDDDEE